MVKNVEVWMNSGKYLPPALRDFHDQKDLFKAIHETIAVEDHGYCKDVSWVQGHCYVIDVFLWFMAKHGYTLQKARHKMEFKDLEQTCISARYNRNKRFMALLGNQV